jgi:hypothetical protein
MTGQWEGCKACGRVVISPSTHKYLNSPINRLEAAVNSSKTAPLIEELKEMADPSKSKNEREKNARTLADFTFVLAKFMYDPKRLRDTELNGLGAQLWEIKAGTLRIPFFGGSCSGTISSFGNSQQLTLPLHVPAPPAEAQCARGTHLFTKQGRLAPSKQIRKAKAIQRQDGE